MRIEKVELKYFKFHQNLTVNINSKNLLVYGENGTGKSSIYEALYSNLYHKKRLDKKNSTIIQEMHRTRGKVTENLEVNITLDNGKTIKRNANELTDLSILQSEYKSSSRRLAFPIEPNIYFANEKVLKSLTEENFYTALNETLFEHFPEMKGTLDDSENFHFKRFRQFQNPNTLKKKIIDEIGNSDSGAIRKKFEAMLQSENKMLKYIINNAFPLKEINDVIEKFDETFKISFEITPAISGNSDILEFNPPKIKLKIDEVDYNGKLSQHFNEAKLKLIGVAIYFTLAKKYEKAKNPFKLLVLDDFLTSLDMANRKLITKYILEEFKDYQKIILTHNLQFFNMTRKMINLYEEDKKKWKVQKLFVHDNQAYLYNKNISYLKEARDRLNNGDEHSAGNFIRKEFERIITEFEQLLELGRVEDLQNIINALKSRDKYYIRSHKNINNFHNQVQEILNDSQKDNQAKINSIQSAFKPLNQARIDFTEKYKNPDGRPSSQTIEALIKQGEFYKNFILNPTSHDDIDIEIYQKECINGINLLEYLNKIITNLKGNRFE